MSRNPSDASPEARREEAVTRRLREAFDRFDLTAGGQCLEAEQIAAYQQRALAPEEAEQCEAHFAACSRCREVLALLTVAEDAAMADQAAAAAAAPAKPSRPRAWRLLWLAPALAATASVALWLMVRMPSRTLESAKSPSLIAEAPPAEQLTAPNHSLAPPSARKALAPPSGSEGSRAAPNSQAEPPSSTSAVSRTAESAPANSSPYIGQASAAKSEVSPVPSANANVAEQGETQTAAPAAAAPPPAAPTESAANTAPAPTQADAQAVRSMSRAATPLAAPQASAGAAAPAPRAGNGAGLFGAARALNTFAVTLQSPTGAVSWRAGAAGRIERSADGGRTWQSQASPLREDWLAGSAVSDTGCWLVGRNGAIVHTEDGEHWQRVAPPAIAADTASGKFPDWASVTATGTGTATIASATQKFLTLDGGQTWRRLQP